MFRPKSKTHLLFEGEFSLPECLEEKTMIINKSQKMANVRYDIRGRISDEADSLERAGINIIRLNTGNPAAFGFETPPSIINALEANSSISAPYSTSKGLPEAREAIARYCISKGIKDVDAEDVYTGNGVSELIQLSLQAFLNLGDEILIPTPDYPLWTAAAILAGGTAVHYICDEQSEWYPDLDDIKRKINARTRAIVIISPNNPTGAVYPKELVNSIVELAREHELVLFSDEIYDRLLMDDAQHTPVATLAPDLLTLTFNGLSKSHQICGYRAGWMTVCGDKSGADGYIEGIRTLASLRLCSNVTAQSVIKAALEDASASNANTSPGGRLYEQREYTYTALNEIPGISVVKSRAGLYMFPKIDIDKYGIVDDERFVLDFLREKHVLLTHGSTYNWKKPDHFRVVYLPKMEELTEVMDRLRDFLEHYHQ